MRNSSYKTETLGGVLFYPKVNSSLFVEQAGYFDERPVVHTSVTQLLEILLFSITLIFSWGGLLLIPAIFFGWGKLYISLPIKTGVQSAESAA